MNRPELKIKVARGRAALALLAAETLEQWTRDAIAERGRALLALSGGSTPWPAFETFAKADLPWDRVHVFQVDERIAPPDSEARNVNGLRALFGGRANLHPMPVERSDLAAAADAYAGELQAIAGPSLILDVVQLGLGDDGHTASLFPGDRANEIDAAVITTDVHAGWRRMSLSWKVLNSARHLLWLIAGEGKRQRLRQLLDGDERIPAGRIERSRAIVLADELAAGTTAD